MGELERRIRQKAHELWEQEGRPEGRAGVHWEKARVLVAIEDDRTSIVPVAPQRVEEASLNNNLDPQPLGGPPLAAPQAEKRVAGLKSPKGSKATRGKGKERDSLLGAFKKGRD